MRICAKKRRQDAGSVIAANTKQRAPAFAEVLRTVSKLLKGHQLVVIKGVIYQNFRPFDLRWNRVTPARREDMPLKLTVKKLTPLMVQLLFDICIDASFEVFEVWREHVGPCDYR